MNRSEQMMADWLAEVEENAPDRMDGARAAMENTVAYQAAAFYDALENACVTILRSLRILR